MEDEKYWQEEIKGRIEEFYESEVETVCYDSGEEFMENLDFFDVVFMDIELRGADGFCISLKYKEFYPESVVIIITTHNELWSKGYQIEAFRYIDKLHLEEIKEALESAATKFQQQKRVNLHVVSTGDIIVLCKDILYIETIGRNLSVHMTQGVYECTGNISAFATDLKTMGFYYIHRSYLVNVEAILLFDRKKVLLENDTSLDMSIYRYKEFKEFYFKWKFVKGNG